MQKTISLHRKSQSIGNYFSGIGKTALTFAITSLFIAMAATAIAQQKAETKKITLAFDNVSLKEAFSTVQRQSGINFVFSQDFEHYEERRVSLQQGNRSVDEAITALLKHTPLRHRWVDRQVVIDVSPTQRDTERNEKTTTQTGRIAGRIVDEAGTPISGATIRLVGSGITTVSTEDGQYALVCPTGTYTIEATHIAHGQQLKHGIVVKHGEMTAVDFSLQKVNEQLDEVVVVGYGTQKKINLTGAVSQVNAEVLQDRPAPSLTRLLQGTLPNLNLALVDGSPTRGASYNLRGTTSIGAGGDALILIDGVEGDPNLLNPNDVESVSILKDASAAAIYGSRAAFGVVLITTKTPKVDQVQINFASNFSLNQRVIVPKNITNGYEWTTKFHEAFQGWTDYKSQPISINNIFPFSLDYFERLRMNQASGGGEKVTLNESTGRYEYFGNTNWDDVFHRKAAPVTEQSLNIAGGNQRSNYYISGRYYFQDGILDLHTDKFSQYNLRAKGDIQLNDWLKLMNNTEFSTYSYSFPLKADGDGNIWRWIELQGYPVAMMYNPDGSYTHSAAILGAASFLDGNNKSVQRSGYFRNTSTVVANPIKNLTLKGDFTYSVRFDRDKRSNNLVEYTFGPGLTGRLGANRLREYRTDINYWASNITAEYAFDLRESHDFKILAGYNIESNQNRSAYYSRDGILSPDKPDFNLMDGNNYEIRGGGHDWAYLGGFFRLNYALKNRYLVEVNGRYDGASKFPANQRFGFFPSASIGWRISQEAFMEGSKSWLDELKVRASYGTLGNGNVAPYSYIERMAVAKSSVILDGVQKSYTTMPGVIPAGLTWERSTTFNVGVDMNLLSNRLDMVFDWYNRQAKDMFTVGRALPSTFGAAVPFGNFADLTTKGWELSLSWRDSFPLAGKPFEYSIKGALWDHRSTVTKYNNDEGIISHLVDGYSSGVPIAKPNYYVGHTIGDIWGYQTLGLFQSEDEIRNHADQRFFENSASSVLLPGDIKLADLNGDNRIDNGDNTIYNPGDMKIIGNTEPRYQFGFTLGGRWNNIGLSAFFQGIGKRDWYFQGESGLFYGPFNRIYGYMPEKMMNDLWSPENPDAYWPRMRGYIAVVSHRTMGVPQTRYLQDISYIRLKTMTLDYSFPNHLLGPIGIKSARVFLTAQNLFTLSNLFKYTDNIDPEMVEDPLGGTQLMLNGGGQGYAYPMLKTTTIGISLSL